MEQQRTRDPGTAAAKPRFRKVLIANRGEIAVRILRTLHEMDIAAVAVYSDADRASLHVRLADEAYAIGPAAASESYLRIDKIIDAARRAGADAIHPGYGFLSENRELVLACDRAGITFIGPPASAMAVLGSKPAARAKMQAAGVPIIPGGDAETAEQARATAARLGYPVMLKAAFGGGGKGMRLVHREEDLTAAFERARSEAGRSFGDATVYLEKAIVKPRHVEIQVLADRDGNTVHLFERDCSIQRRHQKVVEETPCPVASPELVRRMGEVAVRGAQAVGYHSAGTFEFLLGDNDAFYFLEMNTRLQVEHPITEWTTGLDLVAEMVRIAAGEPLGYAQEAVVRRGASLECRVYAEDPTGFLPSPGTIAKLRTPSGPWVRDDSSIFEGAVVASHYDPLLSKLSVWAPDRRSAIARMRRALAEYVVVGIKTNLVFHEKLLSHPEFVAGRYHTGFIEEHAADLLGYASVPAADQSAIATAMAIAAARIDHASSSKGKARAVSSTQTAEEAGNSGSASPISPWITQHRARSLR